MNRTSLAILVFLTCSALSVFYWHVVHPTVSRHLRFRLFARRDKLRRLAMDRREDHLSFAYRDLEGFMCKVISAVSSASLFSFLIFTIRNRNMRSEEFERFEKEASPELCELHLKTIQDAIFVMMLNSPVLVAFGSVFVLILWLVGRFNKMLLYRHAESFVDDLPIQVGGSTLLTA
jgi:hypothetical protein